MPTQTSQSEKLRIPKLRFGGFADVWQEKKLGDVFNEIKSGKDKPEAMGEYFVYGSTGIIGNNKNFTYDGEYILIARVGANAGKLNRVSGKFGVTDNTLVLENNDDVDINFFYNFLESRKLSRLVFGSGQPLVTSGQLKKLKIVIPQTKAEQQKIAEFLELTDKWIENLRTQKESLESYKKGMMQKIFSQEIRFKNENGKSFPEWEEKKLGDCLDYEQPTNYIVKSTEYSNEYKIPVLTAGKTFILGYTDEINGIFKADNLPVIIFDDFTTTQQFVDFPFKVKSSAMKILKAKSGVDIKFIYEAMQLIKYDIGGHGRHWISKYSNIKILMPTLSEQQKIADFLTSVDNLIESKQQQITQAEQWKRGLMQGLFV